MTQSATCSISRQPPTPSRTCWTTPCSTPPRISEWTSILYSDVAGFQEAVEQRASQLADQEQLGITIRQCNVVSVAPRQLKDIFNRVTEARENRTKVLDDAHSYENQITNTAAAQASAIINEAISARARYVQSLQADAKAFSDLLPNYNINPGLFEQQKVVQVMGEVLTNVEFKSYLPTTRQWPSH